MSSRISYADKGKVIAGQSSPPRQPRIRVPNVDNSELIRKHELTLIGRITNPTQGIYTLIPFFSEYWKTSSRAIGTDLGQGMFKFQFATEEDLQLVLVNRPYHFKRWMLILQRWEPTLSKSFPSEIPFWIKVQGLPSHLWSEPIIRSIGENVDFFKELDISEAAARVRVHINGLKPLITTTIMEFDNGEETEVTLVYERLDKHCFNCLKLSHIDRDCPENKEISPPSPSHSTNRTESNHRKEQHHSQARKRDSLEQDNEKKCRPPSRQSSGSRCRENSSHPSHSRKSESFSKDVRSRRELHRDHRSRGPSCKAIQTKPTGDTEIQDMVNQLPALRRAPVTCSRTRSVEEAFNKTVQSLLSELELVEPIGEDVSRS